MNEEIQINELAKAIDRAYKFDRYSLCRYIATMLYKEGYREKNALINEIVSDLHVVLERMRPLRTFPIKGKREFCDPYDLGRDDAISEVERLIFELESYLNEKGI